MTYTVEPEFNGCKGDSFDVVITVNPTVGVDSVADQTLCNGDNTLAVEFNTTIEESTNDEYIIVNDNKWLVKNLETETYSDGTIIPQVQDPQEWLSLNTGAWCYYENSTELGQIYGKLYNRYAIIGKHDNDESTDNKTLAPEGYQMPDNDDWDNLINEFGGNSQAGLSLKSTNLSGKKFINTQLGVSI